MKISLYENESGPYCLYEMKKEAEKISAIPSGFVLSLERPKIEKYGIDSVNVITISKLSDNKFSSSGSFRWPLALEILNKCYEFRKELSKEEVEDVESYPYLI